MKVMGGLFPDTSCEGSGYFGGASEVGCPNCGRQLLQLMYVSDRKVILSPAWSGDPIRLYYCWLCQVSSGQLVYQITEDDKVSFLLYSKGEMPLGFPYGDYPQSVPVIPFGLRELPHGLEILQQAVSVGRTDNWPFWLEQAMTTPRHQVLGSPFVFDESKLLCPICSAEMWLFATVADDVGRGYVMTGNPFVQCVFYTCPRCRVVRAESQCD